MPSPEAPPEPNFPEDDEESWDEEQEYPNNEDEDAADEETVSEDALADGGRTALIEDNGAGVWCWLGCEDCFSHSSNSENRELPDDGELALPLGREKLPWSCKRCDCCIRSTRPRIKGALKAKQMSEHSDDSLDSHDESTAAPSSGSSEFYSARLVAPSRQTVATEV